MLAGLFTPSAAGAADFHTLRQARVELRDVVKAYGDHRVLNGVSLTVEPGEVVTILGPSGSGKSTLIRLINQLESLSGGDIFIDDKPVGQLKGPRCDSCVAALVLYSSSSICMPIWRRSRISPSRWSTSTAGIKPTPHNAPMPCWNRSGWKRKRVLIRHSFPAVNSSGWRLPARWPLRRKFSCLMSPPLLSIRK